MANVLLESVKRRIERVPSVSTVCTWLQSNCTSSGVGAFNMTLRYGLLLSKQIYSIYSAFVSVESSSRDLCNGQLCGCVFVLAMKRSGRCKFICTNHLACCLNLSAKVPVYLVFHSLNCPF